jgi:hypothetical protein
MSLAWTCHRGGVHGHCIRSLWPRHPQQLGRGFFFRWCLFADLVGPRIAVHGPKLRLNAAATEAVGLAVHELATNPGKYGALSTHAGRVDVHWQLDDDTYRMTNAHIIIPFSDRATPQERRPPCAMPSMDAAQRIRRT